MQNSLDDKAIEQRLTEIMAQASLTAISPDMIKMTDELNNIGIDSLGFLEIVVYVEEEFDITVADEDLTAERFDTVQSIKDYIHERMALPASLSDEG